MVIPPIHRVRQQTSFAALGSLASTSLLVCLFGTLSSVGCDQPPSRPHDSPALGDTKRAALFDDQVWITTSKDSVELVERIVGAATPLHKLRHQRAERDEVAILVPRAYLPDISEAQHEEHHRCGGFMQQDSEADALATLHAEQAPPVYAPSYTLDNQATVEKLLPEAKEPNVLATVQKLSSYRTRFHTSTTGEEAAMYIRDTWQLIGKGRDDIKVELVDHQKTPQPSIKMTIRGTSMPDQLVVLGGHMDSISGRGNNTALAPGADDNASGIAALTEIARVAIELDYRPARTVVFYGYAAEEIGLVGSAEIAARAKADKLDVYGVMQLDMTNYTTAKTPYIGVVTDFTDATLNTFSTKLIDQYLHIPYKKFECGYGCSDHASWTKNGYPATAPHEADMEEANDSIHTTNDTLALSKNSVAHTMHFVRFGLSFMGELAKGELKAPEPVCSASKPCPSGERCENDACVPDVSADEPDAATPNGFGDPPASPACSASKACASGSTCVGGTCVVPTGSAGARDAGRASRDGSVADAGSNKPTVRSDSDPSTADDDDESAADEDEARTPAAARESGCTVSSAGGLPSGASLPWLVAGALVLGRRRTQRKG